MSKEEIIITEKTKGFFDIKTIITLIIWAVSMSSLYFTLKFEQETLKKDVFELKETLKKNNLEVINYKLDQILKKIDKL